MNLTVGTRNGSAILRGAFDSVAPYHRPCPKKQRLRRIEKHAVIIIATETWDINCRIPPARRRLCSAAVHFARKQARARGSAVAEESIGMETLQWGAVGAVCDCVEARYILDAPGERDGASDAAR
jgi:hypothetical protein